MNDTQRSAFRHLLSWVAFALTALFAVLAWLAWRDISINLYTYDSPESVSGYQVLAAVVPAVSALLALGTGIYAWFTVRPWNRWMLIILIVLNVAVLLGSLVWFSSGW